MNQRIILASKSPARKAILGKLGLPFEVIVSDFVEDMTLPLSASELALYLSRGKASSLAKQYPNAVVIAADTFVVFQGAFLGKPKDEDDARKMLTGLAGNTHTILTGLTVVQAGKTVSEVIFTEVKMKNVDESKISEYVASGEPLGKAGSYAIQGKGKELVEKIEGDYFNIMGLPLKTIAQILIKDFSIPVNFVYSDTDQGALI
ncbi:MAG: Maf family protein [bacterium]